MQTQNRDKSRVSADEESVVQADAKKAVDMLALRLS